MKLDIKEWIRKVTESCRAEYMIAVPTVNQTLSSANTVTICNLSTVLDYVGSRLTFDAANHKIVIGDDVHHVEVSGEIYVYTSGSNGAKNAYIYKNSTSVARSVQQITSNYNSIGIIPRIIPVTTGDEITLRANSQTGTTTVLGESSDGTVAFLMVSVLD